MATQTAKKKTVSAKQASGVCLPLPTPLQRTLPYKEPGDAHYERHSNYIFISMENKPAVLDEAGLSVFEQLVAEAYHSLVPHLARKGAKNFHPWIRVMP